MAGEWRAGAALVDSVSLIGFDERTCREAIPQLGALLVLPPAGRNALVGLEMFVFATRPPELTAAPLLLAPRLQTFVLTQQDGAHLYAFAVLKSDPIRTAAGPRFAERALVVVSRFAFHETVPHILAAFCNALPRNAVFDEQTARALHELLVDVTVPDLGQVSLVRVGNHEIKIRVPGPYSLPMCEVDFCPLFTCLSPDNVVEAFRAVVCETQIIFMSNDSSILTPCIEALTSLLYPLQPVAVYITVVPPALSDIIEAPTPFVLGIVKAMADLMHIPNSVAIVDLDANTVRVPADVPELPTRIVNKLRRCIRRFAPLHSLLRSGSAQEHADDVMGSDVPNRYVTSRTLNVLYSSSEPSDYSDSDPDFSFAEQFDFRFRRFAAPTDDQPPGMPAAASAPAGAAAASATGAASAAVPASSTPAEAQASGDTAAQPAEEAEAAAAEAKSEAGEQQQQPAPDAVGGAGDVSPQSFDEQQTPSSIDDLPMHMSPARDSLRPGGRVLAGGADSDSDADSADGGDAGDADAAGSRGDGSTNESIEYAPVSPPDSAGTAAAGATADSAGTAAAGATADSAPAEAPAASEEASAAPTAASAAAGANEAAASSSSGDRTAGEAAHHAADRHASRSSMSDEPRHVRFGAEPAVIPEKQLPAPLREHGEIKGRLRSSSSTFSVDSDEEAAPRTRLRTHLRVTALRNVFSGVFMSLLKNYREFLIVPEADVPNDSFIKEEEFVASVAEDMGTFLRVLLRTQMFSFFVQDRLLHTGDCFDMRVQEKLDRRYHEIDALAATTVKGKFIKKGRIVKNWKERSFELADMELRYFDPKTGESRGTLLLVKGKTEVAIPKLVEKGPTRYPLELINPGRKFIFCALTSDMRRELLKVIKAKVDPKAGLARHMIDERNPLFNRIRSRMSNMRSVHSSVMYASPSLGPAKKASASGAGASSSSSSNNNNRNSGGDGKRD